MAATDMTVVAARYRETLHLLVLRRALGGLTEEAEDSMLDTLDKHWERMVPSERAAANQYAADLAIGIDVPSRMVLKEWGWL